MREIQVLDPKVANRLTRDFLKGDAGCDVADLVRPFERPEGPVPAVEPLELLVDEAMRRFESPEDSDAWLSPRLHACLRLTRREAADRGLWAWLAIVAFSDYVRWRFPGKEDGAPVVRFIGREDLQTLSRLWWGAELTRNGDDYAPVVAAFRMQDIPNTWLRLDAFHHRPAAVAAVTLLQDLSSDDINRLSTAFNHTLTTVVLDSVAPNPPSDPAAIQEWIHEAPDETLMLDELPVGPSEPQVPPEDVEKLAALLHGIAFDIGIEGEAA